MCLITLDSMLTADKDIVCYKILRLNLDGEYTSYYHPEHKWNLNELYGTALDQNPSKNLKIIEFGFHSYKSLEDAQEVFNDLEPDAVLVKCVIPQGASYYFGSHQLREGFTSSEMKITEIISRKGTTIEPDNYPYKKEDKLMVDYIGRKIYVIVLGIYEYQGHYYIKTARGFIKTDKEGNSPHVSIQNVRDLKSKGE